MSEQAQPAPTPQPSSRKKSGKPATRPPVKTQNAMIEYETSSGRVAILTSEIASVSLDSSNPQRVKLILTTRNGMDFRTNSLGFDEVVEAMKNAR